MDSKFSTAWTDSESARFVWLDAGAEGNSIAISGTGISVAVEVTSWVTPTWLDAANVGLGRLGSGINVAVTGSGRTDVFVGIDVIILVGVADSCGRFVDVGEVVAVGIP